MAPQSRPDFQAFLQQTLPAEGGRHGSGSRAASGLSSKLATTRRSADGQYYRASPQTERIVHCVKLHQDLPGFTEVPFDGHPLGQRIYDNVSKQAWGMWVEQMKMIMNEYRFNLGTTEAQEFLFKQMEEYFFGEGAAHPPGYVAPGPLGRNMQQRFPQIGAYMRLTVMASRFAAPSLYTGLHRPGCGAPSGPAIAKRLAERARNSARCR